MRAGYLLSRPLARYFYSKHLGSKLQASHVAIYVFSVIVAKTRSTIRREALWLYMANHELHTYGAKPHHVSLCAQAKGSLSGCSVGR